MIEQPSLLNNQAIILAGDGNYNEAIACFKRAITLEMDNWLLWFNLGTTYRDSGDLKNARDSLATAYKIAPHNQDVASTYAQICLSLKDFDTVQHICQEELDFNPLNTDLWNILGVSCFQTEKYNEAAEYFEIVLSINPYHEDAIYNLKDTYHVLGNINGETECELKLKERSNKR